MDHALAGGTDYFATYNITEEWIKGGRRRRSYSSSTSRCTSPTSLIRWGAVRYR
jgi:hypothetical protein